MTSTESINIEKADTSETASYVEEEAQSLKLALRQPWVRSVTYFAYIYIYTYIFLSLGVRGQRACFLPYRHIFPLTVYGQCVLIIAELARGADEAEIWNHNLCPVGASYVKAEEICPFMELNNVKYYLYSQLGLAFRITLRRIKTDVIM